MRLWNLRSRSRGPSQTIPFAIAAAIAALVASSPASAIPIALPDATASASVGANCGYLGYVPPAEISIVPPDSLPIDLDYDTDEGCAYPPDYEPDDKGSASGSASVEGGSDPTIIVRATADGEDAMAGSGAGVLTFYFQVTGPGSGEVAINMYGSSTLDSAIYGDNYSVQLDTSVSVSFSDEYSPDDIYPSNYYPYSNYGGGSLDSTFDVAIGGVYSVYMSASAFVLTFGDGASASGMAIVDPTFSLGPNCTGCSILYSPGINATRSPTTSVPEPASWSLFFAGLWFLGLGGVFRARKAWPA